MKTDDLARLMRRVAANTPLSNPARQALIEGAERSEILAGLLFELWDAAVLHKHPNAYALRSIQNRAGELGVEL